MPRFRRRRVAAPGMLPPRDFNGQPLPPPTANDFVSNLQSRMWSYCHTEGLARFSVAFVADAGSRVELVAERYIRELGGWCQDFELPKAKKYESQAQFVNYLVERFRGRYTLGPQNVWSMLWHKRSAGEVFLVAEDVAGLGAVYTPYGFKACERMNRGAEKGWKIMDRPGGTFAEGGGARWVPDRMVIRCWTPHPDYPLLPYSALWAGLKDLDRHALMSKVIDRGANSALLRRGIMWVPGEAMDETVAVGTAQVPRLAADYYAAAKQTIEAISEGSVEAIAPYIMHYDSDLNKPELIEFKLPFDEQWMNVRATTVEDFARSVDLPSVTVVNGGAGGGGNDQAGNHWSELLVDRRTFDMTVGRDLDSLTHEDLTRYFLMPQLAHFAGLQPEAPPQGEVGLWRVGFDPTKLIVNQDRSLQVPDALRIGLINFKAAAKRLGFREDEMAGPDDIKRLAEIVSASSQSMDMTRVRRRPTEANADGSGAQVNTPIQAALKAALVELQQDGEKVLQWVDF